MVKELSKKQKENRRRELGIENMDEWDKIYKICKKIKDGRDKRKRIERVKRRNGIEV